MSIHMKKGKKRTEGFTLVELICVIAILGILVAIACLLYTSLKAGVPIAGIELDIGYLI